MKNKTIKQWEQYQDEVICTSSILNTFIFSPLFHKNHGFKQHDKGKMKNISVIGIIGLTIEAISKFLLTQYNLRNIPMTEITYKTTHLVKNVVK